MDCVCTITQLPAKLAVGDWLAFQNMGAYTVCAASQFNGFEVSNVIYTSGEGLGSIEVRRALKSLCGGGDGVDAGGSISVTWGDHGNDA